MLVSKAKLSPAGVAILNINGKKQVEVTSGSTLLQTLGNNKIFLPSACGGGGTCAMCKCQVLSGGGDILPTEKPYFSRKEIADNWRLGCQVKVKGSMDVKVPEEIFGIKKWTCDVMHNYNVSSFIKAFVLKLPEGEILDFKAGGYIQVDVPECEVDYKDIDISPDENDEAGKDKFKSEWDKFKLWDLKMKNDSSCFRAYSMANHPAEGNIVMLTVRIATPPWNPKKNGWSDINPGICSSYVFSRKPGDKVTISGPYGEFFIKNTDAEMVYIGGGAGMAPMRSHLFHLFHTLKTERKVTFYYGGRSKKELFYVDDFRDIEKKFPNFKFHVVLSEPLPEDNWIAKKTVDDNGDGYVGFVHNAVIEHHLKPHKSPEDIEFYFCGPPMMNDAVVKMCDDWGIPKENVSFDDFG
ncbi:Na(+)-translocating NADH-quinone reductase subunit F [Ichthyobacterium seriolicida]|uniref:Na(+)-translocating NADH-quinone reductase subunit F n=1 Tax=Ichthyobacterium seriolicida TaxID=242600 RepID=A0A1J1DZD8_9FLAO|nr:Na(+)-translocating NADH-quinone reductase subunit F [Ichthyobacterium seriolicida]